MAIQNRRGLRADFQASKMVPGEFAICTDSAEIFYCYASGIVKELCTIEEVQALLDSSEDAYIALQELIADLEDETVLTGILADIVDLKADVASLQSSMAQSSTSVNIYSLQYLEDTADCHIIKLPNGKNILVDGGTSAESTYITNKITALGVTKIDYIVVTHYHPDHVGGLTAICNAINSVGAIIYLPVDFIDAGLVDASTIAGFNAVTALITAKSMTHYHPTEFQTIDMGLGVTVEFINTIHTSYYVESTFDYNNASLCFYLKLGTQEMFFSGDISLLAQAYLSTVGHKCDVVKAEHHLYNRFFNKDYYNTIFPMAVICTDSTGEFKADTDHYSYVNALSMGARWYSDHGIPVYCQGENGDLHIILYNQSFEIVDAQAKQFTNSKPIHYDSLDRLLEEEKHTNTDLEIMTWKDILSKMKNNSTLDFNVANTYTNLLPNSDAMGTSGVYCHAICNTSYAYFNSGDVTQNMRFYIIQLFSRSKTIENMFMTGTAQYTESTDELLINWNQIKTQAFAHITTGTITGTVAGADIDVTETFYSSDLVTISGDEITIRGTGLYKLDLNIYGVAGTGGARSRVFVNGTVYMSAVAPIVNSWSGYGQYNRTLYLTAGDVLKINVDTNTASGSCRAELLLDFMSRVQQSAY